MLYQWKAPSSGTYVFDTLTPGIDSVLYVLDGCTGPELACNDNFVEPPDGNLGSFVGVQLTAGQTVVVAVDSYAASGGFTLDVAGPVASGNCCAQHGTPGCQITDLEFCVCAIDDYCCTFEWDRLCVSEAISDCGGQCG